MGTGPRLYVKITRDTLPRVKDKYPFLYLEHGRLAIDDSSVKWIDSDGNVVRIPIATICSLFLGPGTTVTHEAIKVLSAANCSVCWMGEDRRVCNFLWAARSRLIDVGGDSVTK